MGLICKGYRLVHSDKIFFVRLYQSLEAAMLAPREEVIK